jgi:thymidine kinase
MFSDFKMDSELKIIVGPMFSGKTSAIIKQWKINKLKNIPTLVVNYSEDVRYSNTNLSSHDKIEIPCIKLLEMKEIYKHLNDTTSCVLINEGQFFPDLYDVVKELIEVKKISVVVSGLDGDFKMNKFGQILDLIPMANYVEKLFAVCYNCKKKASFTKRNTTDEKQKIIGTGDIYDATCRDCYDN